MKTTQPRRYLVRPNQGIIEPGQIAKVQILLVEKDKNSLLESYERLGQTALDHSKDKFLVQSVAIPDISAAQALKDYDRLTAFWASVAGNSAALMNKKLSVKHIVSNGGAAGGTASSSTKAPPAPETRQPIDIMSSEQAKEELKGLRRKYDELVAFSVNLTAERDMLNNALEQTKRDLNREVSQKAAADNARGRGTATAFSSMDSAMNAKSSSTGISFLFLLVVAVGMLVAGVKLEQVGMTSKLPLIGSVTGDKTMKNNQRKGEL